MDFLIDVCYLQEHTGKAIVRCACFDQQGGLQLTEAPLGPEYVYKHLPAARAVALLYSTLRHYGTSPNMPLEAISSPLLAGC